MNADNEYEVNIAEVDTHLVGVEIGIINAINHYMYLNKISLRQAAAITNMAVGTLRYHLSGEADHSLSRLLHIAQKLGFGGSICVTLNQPDSEIEP